MNNETHLLEEYNEEIVIKKNKLYTLLLILLGAYHGFILLDCFFDFSRFSLKRMQVDWSVIGFAFILPGIGFAFVAAKRNIGWFISTLFFYSLHLLQHLLQLPIQWKTRKNHQVFRLIIGKLFFYAYLSLFPYYFLQKI